MNRYDRDVAQFLALKADADSITDTDPATAYDIMKRSNILYERWSEILYDVRKTEAKKGSEAAFKDRVESVMKYLSNVHTYTRMIWNRGKEER